MSEKIGVWEESDYPNELCIMFPYGHKIWIPKQAVDVFVHTLGRMIWFEGWTGFTLDVDTCEVETWEEEE